MLWTFRRGTQQLRYELRATAGSGYLLSVTLPDGTSLLKERFSSPHELHERARRVEHLLVRHGWHSPHLTASQAPSAAKWGSDH